jgi:hypothetical protein
MSYPLCRHIHSKGTRCKSPALHERAFCYFHAKLHLTHNAYLKPERRFGYSGEMLQMNLPPVEDIESVQMALSTVIAALASARLETPRAMALFYGLQLSAANVGKMKCNAESGESVREVGATEEGVEIAISPADSPELKLGCRQTAEEVHLPITEGKLGAELTPANIRPSRL